MKSEIDAYDSFWFIPLATWVRIFIKDKAMTNFQSITFLCCFKWLKNGYIHTELMRQNSFFSLVSTFICGNHRRIVGRKHWQEIVIERFTLAGRSAAWRMFKSFAVTPTGFLSKILLLCRKDILRILVQFLTTGQVSQLTSLSGEPHHNQSTLIRQYACPTVGMGLL